MVFLYDYAIADSESKKPIFSLKKYIFPFYLLPIPIPSSPCVAGVGCLMSIPSLRAGPTRGTSHARSQGKKLVEEWLSTEGKILFL